MEIKIKKSFAPNTTNGAFDILQLKKALNQLGYYMPSADTGIKAVADKEIFVSLKAFQKDYALEPTGQLRPDDETIQAINKALKETTGVYIWRTVNDENVRQSHADLNGQIRDWSNSPDPGEDFNCRCWAELLDNSAESRKKAILNKGNADFTLKPNDKASSDEPWYSIRSQSEVRKYDNIIKKIATEEEIDPDIIRAIIYVETTQGWYDQYAPYELNKTLRPTNIHAEYWKELGYNRDQLKIPEINIKVGAFLLKKIIELMPNKNIAEIATVYNSLGATKVSDYGVRVEKVYKTKPW